MFFESEIVQDEANACSATTELTQLGGDYGKFGPKARKLFIERMETLMEIATGS